MLYHERWLSSSRSTYQIRKDRKVSDTLCVLSWLHCAVHQCCQCCNSSTKSGYFETAHCRLKKKKKNCGMSKLSTCEYRWGSPSSLHNEWARLNFPLCGACYTSSTANLFIFPTLPVLIYTPGSTGIITVRCLTQGHNTLAIMGLEPTTFCLWT